MVAALVAATLMLGAPAAPGQVPTSFERLDGYAAAGTPAKYNKVGVLKFGPRTARNVLILNPGTSASAAYFAPLARDVASRADGWQVWAVERRENLLEDHSVLNRAKDGRATNRQLFDYYLGWVSDPSVTNHFDLIPDAQVGFARRWGMRVEIEDLRRVVRAARARGGKIVMGGHSLGGTITSAYATWDFEGRPGARDLSGLVFIDGGSSPAPVTPEQAQASLAELDAGSPWLSFGGIPAPYAGLFNSSGVARGDPRPRRPVARADVLGPAGQPQAARPGHQPGAVRVRAGLARPRPRGCARRRRTSAGWRRAATRGAGTRRASSRRSAGMPACSRAGASRAWTARPGTTRAG